MKYLWNLNRQKWSWVFYDWASSAFATTVMAGFFPIFFRKYWSYGADAAATSLKLGAANSLASLCVAMLAPFLGAIADAGGRKRMFLMGFSLLAMLSNVFLAFCAQGAWHEAAFFYTIAIIGYSSSIIFNDAQIVDVCEPQEYNLLSTTAYAFGYLGGGLLFTLNVLMYLKPLWFGLENGVEGVRWSFVSVSLWWLLFSLPVFFWVQDKTKAQSSFKALWGQSLRQMRQTAGDIAKYRPIVLFLCAYWLYIDGVGTIIKMAVDYGMSIGFQSKDLISALLMIQFIGFPCAIGMGHLADRVGTKKSIYICLSVYTVLTIYAYFLDNLVEFYTLAVGVALVQGGVQALSRSFFASLIPKEYATEFFGFYNMLGKFASVLGPLLMGLVSYYSQSPRLSMLSISIFYILGGLILRKVKDPSV